MMKKSEDVWNAIFNLICIIGCLYQLHSIVSAYFEYGTVTKINYSKPSILHYPSLHYCFLCLEDAINITEMESKYGISVQRNSSNEIFRLMDIITIADMIEFTPSGEIEDCSYRDAAGNNMIEGQKFDCNIYFNIRKYVVQQYICYALTAKKQSSFMFRSIETSLQYDRSIFEIRFTGVLARYRKIRPIITQWKYPYLESAYAPAYYKDSEEDMTIHVSCQNISNHLLGFPFDEFVCEEKSETNFFHCLDSCMENVTMENLGRMPFTSFLDERTDGKLVSDSMVKNETVSNMLNEWYIGCKKSCPMFPCHHHYCLTVGRAVTSIMFKNVQGSGSSILVDAPPYPDTDIIHLPNVPLIDSLIYILSSLGTWFGFVIISCNPISIIRICYHGLKTRRVRRVESTETQPERDVFLFTTSSREVSTA